MKDRNGNEVVMGTQLYCAMELLPAYWIRDERLGTGKVCNTPVTEGFPCPNKKQHRFPARVPQD